MPRNDPTELDVNGVTVSPPFSATMEDHCFHFTASEPIHELCCPIAADAINFQPCDNTVIGIPSDFCDQFFSHS